MFCFSCACYKTADIMSSWMLISILLRVGKLFRNGSFVLCDLELLLQFVTVIFSASSFWWGLLQVAAFCCFPSFPRSKAKALVNGIHPLPLFFWQGWPFSGVYIGLSRSQ